MAQPTDESRQRLQYVCDMLAQLRAIIPPQAGSLLPYLIDMAQLEASEALVRQPQGKIET